MNVLLEEFKISSSFVLFKAVIFYNFQLKEKYTRLYNNCISSSRFIIYYFTVEN